MKTILSLVLPSLGFLVPMIAGVLTNYALQALKRLNLALDAAPAAAKQGANALLAIIIVALCNFAGVAVVGDPATWAGNVPPETIQALLAALVAHVIHSGKKTDERKANAASVPNPFRLP